MGYSSEDMDEGASHKPNTSDRLARSAGFGSISRGACKDGEGSATGAAGSGCWESAAWQGCAHITQSAD